MKVIALQSGSNGNCVYVEADGVRLLFDAGISGRQMHERLSARGRDTTGMDALIISHDHSDHISAMGVVHRRFELPVYVTEQTLAAAKKNRSFGNLGDVRHFRAG